MATLDPRVRLLLRQADKAAEAGKRPAAYDLYKQTIEEAPDADVAWVGLASVANSEEEQRSAYEQALKLNPGNEAAQRGLAMLNGELVEEEEVVREETAVSEPLYDNLNLIEDENEALLACYRHPKRETGLRCYNCNRPICINCSNKTPVGYLCPECIREKEDLFFNAKSSDYVLAALLTFPLSVIAGIILTFLGGGFWFILIAFWIGGAVGAAISRLAKRAVGNRRGRYLPHTIAVLVILGVLTPNLSLFLLAGTVGNFLMPIAFLVAATGAAFYAAR